MLYLWSGEHVKRLFPGFETPGRRRLLAAHRAVLRRASACTPREKRFELLRPLVDITTTLDPRLEIAYRYGAIFLSEAPPVGAGRPREGIEVLARGVENLPGSWRLRQDYGFFHYLFLDDAEKAAAILIEAADLPGAAFWLRMMAADLLTKGGEPGRRPPHVAADVRAGGGGDHPPEREVAARDPRLARRGRRRLEAAVAELERRNGLRPARLEELRAAGLWRGPLTDAAGVPFGYDRKTGRVVIARESPLWRPDPPRGGTPE